ncbi:MAG: glycosyltransferase [Candidatus Sumerlaeia bacterium]|nr:glycosyltransferase [Candidatus Sumerlaeia bacterium]
MTTVLFEFVTYRWGTEYVGGAELHHQRLARELVDAGHQVRIITGDGGAIEPFCHWGVRWANHDKQENEDPDIPVVRHPVRKWPTWAMALAAKAIQRRMEHEAPGWIRRAGDGLIAAMGSSPGTHLLSGWHHHEMQGNEVRRWCSQKAFIGVRLPEDRAGKLFVGGTFPKPNRVIVRLGGEAVVTQSLAVGQGLITMDLPRGYCGIVELDFRRGWRPLRDFRTLTLLADSVVLQDETGINYPSDLQKDHRALGRSLGAKWEDMLVAAAAERPAIYNWLMDQLRGPILPMGAITPTPEPGTIRIHCNMPWATVSGAGKDDLVMALWHVDDDYYAWDHWIQALKRCRFVLANSPYTAFETFPRHGIRAHFVGPPIWEPDAVPSDAIGRDLARDIGLEEGEILVLTICRKSPEKGYEEIARVVEEMRRDGHRIRFAGIGPDNDRRPLEREGCIWLGKRTWEELQAAYHICDIFVLNSESESFGMVIPEAWHHGRPVVVNRTCGPAASIVTEEVDGLLAGSKQELRSALERLAGDQMLRESLGSAGREKARRDHTRGAAAGRLLAALEKEGLLTD